MEQVVGKKIRNQGSEQKAGHNVDDVERPGHDGGWEFCPIYWENKYQKERH